LGGIGRYMKSEHEHLVRMYEEEFLINTKTKEGYDRVLKKIYPLVCKWASKIYISGYHTEDLRQEFSVMIIEGINAFNPEKKVKLSTFLHNHLKNKIISKLKSANKLSNDAYGYLHQKEASLCSCGGVIQKKKSLKVCVECGAEHGSAYRVSRDELIFSAMPKKNPMNGEEYDNFESSLSSSDGIYSIERTAQEEVDLSMMMDRLERQVDEKTLAILKMVCLEGHSIKDAAKQVGITGWAASMRLKRIKTNKAVVDFLEDFV